MKLIDWVLARVVHTMLPTSVSFEKLNVDNTMTLLRLKVSPIFPGLSLDSTVIWVTFLAVRLP